MNDENDYGAALTADVTAGQAAPEAASHVGHTATPWKVAPYCEDDETINVCAGYSDKGNGQSQADWIAQLDAENVEGGIATNIANAEFIVRACNCHDELLAALKAMVASYDGLRDTLTSPVVLAKLAAADAAIQKAEPR